MQSQKSQQSSNLVEVKQLTGLMSQQTSAMMGSQYQFFFYHETVTQRSVELTVICLSVKQDIVKYNLSACFYLHGEIYTHKIRSSVRGHWPHSLSPLLAISNWLGKSTKPGHACAHATAEQAPLMFNTKTFWTSDGGFLHHIILDSPSPSPPWIPSAFSFYSFPVTRRHAA